MGWTEPYNGCNTFDGTSASETYASNASHNRAGLAYYKGKPTSVGSAYSTGYRKVEDYPINVFGHTLVGLDSGDLLVIGGKERSDSGGSENLNEIWRMSAIDGSVTKAGDLLKHSYSGASLFIDNSIYVVDKYYGGDTN